MAEGDGAQLRLGLDTAPMKAALAEVRSLLQSEAAAREATVRTSAKAEGDAVKSSVDQQTASRRGGNAAAKASSAQLREALSADLKAYVQAVDGRVRDASGRFVAGQRSMAAASKQASAEASSAFASMGKAGSDGLLAIGMAIPGLALGFDKLIGSAQAYSNILKEIEERQTGRAKSVNERMDRFGTVATLTGKTVDAEFMVDQARLQKRTGLTEDESIKAQESFYNKGAQYVGEGPGRVSQETATAVFEGTAKLGVARHIDSDVIADLAAGIMGSRDWSKLGKGAADAIIVEANKTFAVLSTGTGKESQLGSETAKLAASTVNEDDLKGSFKNTYDPAILISALTEGYPTGQAEAAGSAIRALRAFDKEQGSTLQAAGISTKDDVFSALDKLQVEMAKQAKAMGNGATVQDALNKNFPDVLAARSLGVLLNKGAGESGVFVKRRKTIDENASMDAVNKTTTDFRTSQRGVERANKARANYIETEKGARTSRLEQVRDQATLDYQETGQLQGPIMKMASWAINKASMGSIDPEAIVKDEQTKARLLSRMSPELSKRYIGASLSWGATDRTNILNEMVGAISAEGGNATTGMWRPGVNKGVIDAGPAPQPMPPGGGGGIRPGVPGNNKDEKPATAAQMDELIQLQRANNKIVAGPIEIVPKGPPPAMIGAPRRGDR